MDILSIVYSLCLCDHTGDVADVIDKIVKNEGINVEWDGLSDLAEKLGEMGVESIWGKSMEPLDELIDSVERSLVRFSRKTDVSIESLRAVPFSVYGTKVNGYNVNVEVSNGRCSG